MFLNSWSLTLTLCSIIVLFLMTLAGRTALRVLRFWNPASDSNRQIQLESETWLASTLVVYALGFQIISLILFVLAADQFCQVIVGAMCATGALLANSYGMPALYVKIAGVFLYGFWIVLHKLDISSEKYPLVRFKYIFLLFLLPYLFADIILQTLYIAGLKPDIITSCCAVVFGTSTSSGPNLLESFSELTVLTAFYVTAALLVIVGGALLYRFFTALSFLYAAGWVWFFGLAMLAVISVISSYIYAMPFHNCPFCIIKPEYNYIGFFIYATLIPAAFFGVVPALINPVKKREGLDETVKSFQKLSVSISVALLLIFTVLSSYHFILYKITGGET